MIAVPKLVLTLSVVAFVAALFQKAFYVGNDPSGWSGTAALISGAFGVIGGYPAWLANPFLFASWILSLLQKPGWTTICATIAALFALSFLYHKVIIVDEGGTLAKISGYGLGYGLWLSSTVLMIGGGGYSLLVKSG
jgi:hypothetical protein